MVHDVEGRIKVIVAHSDQLEHDILSQNSGGNDNMQSRLVYWFLEIIWDQQFSK